MQITITLALNELCLLEIWKFGDWIDKHQLISSSGTPNIYTITH